MTTTKFPKFSNLEWEKGRGGKGQYREEWDDKWDLEQNVGSGNSRIFEYFFVFLICSISENPIKLQKFFLKIGRFTNDLKNFVKTIATDKANPTAGSPTLSSPSPTEASASEAASKK